MNFVVYGIPGAQGSKRYVGHSKAGRAILIENSAKVKPWREAVVYAAVEEMNRANLTPIAGAVFAEIRFYLPRPKSAKPNAQASKAPDIDKLLRSTFDALTTAAVWEDDSRVVRLVASKRYVDDRVPRPGAVIALYSAGNA